MLIHGKHLTIICQIRKISLQIRQPLLLKSTVLEPKLNEINSHQTRYYLCGFSKGADLFLFVCFGWSCYIFCNLIFLCLNAAFYCTP